MSITIIGLPWLSDLGPPTGQCSIGQ